MSNPVQFALFLAGPRGRSLAVGYRPVPSGTHWVLMVPPLFEELNKSRRTLALFGAALAARGIGSLLPDLYGTGDSEGTIGDANWDTWIEDLTGAHTWLRTEGATRVDLLATRGGALLVWDWLARMSLEVPRLILWHPITNGRQLVQHLLRLRLAADLMGRGTGETTAALRARLATEGVLEIAGYHLSAPLIASIEAITLGAPGARRLGAVDWYQVMPIPDQAVPRSVTQYTESWNDATVPMRVHRVCGDGFWATQEIVEGTALIEMTLNHFSNLQTENDST
jgi:exosortase A-associated hydrolase 2